MPFLPRLKVGLGLGKGRAQKFRRPLMDKIKPGQSDDRDKKKSHHDLGRR